MSAPRSIGTRDPLDQPQPRRHRDAGPAPIAIAAGNRIGHASVANAASPRRAADGAEDQSERRRPVRADLAHPQLGGHDRAHRDQEHESRGEHRHRRHRRSQQDREQPERERWQPEDAERGRHHDLPVRRAGSGRDAEVGSDPPAGRRHHRLGDRARRPIRPTATRTMWIRYGSDEWCGLPIDRTRRR